MQMQAARDRVQQTGPMPSLPAVLLAAMGVFGTDTGWPDVIVAAIMGGGLRGRIGVGAI
jgi:hypothetical protein